MLLGRHSREGGNPAPTVDLCLLGDDKARGAPGSMVLVVSQCGLPLSRE
ncbi:hypothetical protein [Endozoicomonas sp. 2B-B]